jgi:uncharacterized coiled-coil DUF342 family protein
MYETDRLDTALDAISKTLLDIHKELAALRTELREARQVVRDEAVDRSH